MPHEFAGQSIGQAFRKRCPFENSFIQQRFQCGFAGDDLYRLSANLVPMNFKVNQFHKFTGNTAIILKAI